MFQLKRKIHENFAQLVLPLELSLCIMTLHNFLSLAQTEVFSIIRIWYMQFKSSTSRQLNFEKFCQNPLTRETCKRFKFLKNIFVLILKLDKKGRERENDFSCTFSGHRIVWNWIFVRRLSCFVLNTTFYVTCMRSFFFFLELIFQFTYEFLIMFLIAIVN